MKITDFDVYRDLLKRHSGLSVTPDQSYILESRLSPVARKWGYPSLGAMTLALQSAPDKELIHDIVQAMTTLETWFFRDKKSFDMLRAFALPYFLKARASQKSLRFWSAASSSGQESYSLAMLLKDMDNEGLVGWQMDILATDISSEALDHAREGLYSQFEVQRGLPIRMLIKYFIQNDGKWQIADNIRKMVRFAYYNLLDDMKRPGAFDITFCRNVLTFFDSETRTDVLQRLSLYLADDGFLFLDAAEDFPELNDLFRPVSEKRGVYVKRKSRHVGGHG